MSDSGGENFSLRIFFAKLQLLVLALEFFGFGNQTGCPFSWLAVKNFSPRLVGLQSLHTKNHGSGGSHEDEKDHDDRMDFPRLVAHDDRHKEQNDTNSCQNIKQDLNVLNAHPGPIKKL